MYCFEALSAIILVALSATAEGRPATVPRDGEILIDDLLGFDESLKKFPLDENAIIPEFISISDDDFSGNETVTEVAPYTVTDDELEKRWIVGVDDRRLFNEARYPFNTVGKISWTNGLWCSGALVGPRHVLTARHCWTDGSGGTFAPGYDNRARFGSANIAYAIGSVEIPPITACGTKDDWMVLIIDQRLGDELGWFGVKLPDPAEFDKPKFSHIGYPQDKDNGNRPYRQTRTTVHSKRTLDCDSTGPFYTDTDTEGGQSGGPHWGIDAAGDRWIWGTLSMGVTGPEETYAGWASGDQMVSTIARLRNDFP